jgi:hypothetical protein
MFIRKSRLRLGKFATSDTKRLLQQNRHLASFAAQQHFGSYWGKADMSNGFSEGATVKSLKA